MFDCLINLLSHDPSFQSRGVKPQRHVKYQLGCFLVRYGMRACDSLETTREPSLGHGTVFVYCKRVSESILTIVSPIHCVVWRGSSKSHEEPIEDGSVAKSDMPVHGLVLLLNGTDVRLLFIMLASTFGCRKWNCSFVCTNAGLAFVIQRGNASW